MRPSPFEEIELKLAVSPADAAFVLQHPRLAADTPRVRILDSVYFDTQDFDLARRGFVLRIRTSGPERIQAVKTRSGAAAGLLRRGEWEVPVEGDVPDLSRLPKRKLRKRLEAAVGGGELLPIVRTHVQRTSFTVEDADWAVRVDLDIGEAKTLKGSLPIGSGESGAQRLPTP
jgi:inorganic triphosphatase YgiF